MCLLCPTFLIFFNFCAFGLLFQFDEVTWEKYRKNPAKTKIWIFNRIIFPIPATVRTSFLCGMGKIKNNDYPLQDTLEKDVCFYLYNFPRLIFLYPYNFPYNLSSSPPKNIVENKTSFLYHFVVFCFFKMKSLFVTQKKTQKRASHTHRQTHGLMVCKLYYRDIL